MLCFAEPVLLGFNECKIAGGELVPRIGLKRVLILLYCVAVIATDLFEKAKLRVQIMIGV